MTLLTVEDFEGGTDGAPVTTATTQPGAFVGGSVSFTSDAIVGDMAMMADATGSPTYGYWRSPAGPMRSDSWVSFFVKLPPGAPAMDFYLARFQTDAAERAILLSRWDGALQMRSTSGAVGPATPSGLVSGDPIRVDWYVGAAHQELRVFTGDNLMGTVPDHAVGPSPWTPTGQHTMLAVGSPASIAGVRVIVDYVQVDDATWPSPPPGDVPTHYPWRLIVPEGSVPLTPRVV